MPPSQGARVRRVLAGRVTLVLGSLFLLTMLAQTDSELPGNARKPAPNKTMVCIDCLKRIVPEYPKDGSGPKCPNNADHKLRPR